MTKVDNPIKLESLILAVTGFLLYHLSMTSFALTMIFLIAGIVELFDDLLQVKIPLFTVSFL